MAIIISEDNGQEMINRIHRLLMQFGVDADALANHIIINLYNKMDESGFEIELIYVEAGIKYLYDQEEKAVERKATHTANKRVTVSGKYWDVADFRPRVEELAAWLKLVAVHKDKPTEEDEDLDAWGPSA